MPKLDPDGIREFAGRDRAALEQLSRPDRAARPVEEKVRVAIALYEAARATSPGWPSEADRRADLAHHLALRALMDRVGDVVPR